jgi:D-tyrosyl-tRNA(Tyr) deacylase
MKCLIQRVSQAAVRLQTTETHGIHASKNLSHPIASSSSLQTFESSIGKGLVALVGIEKTDSIRDVEYIARKLLTLRLFPNDDGKPWDLSVQSARGSILCVSQFTLSGRNKKGTKMDFSRAMAPDQAKEMYEELLKRLRRDSNVDIKDGVFGAMMDVSIVNDGPVTILLDSRE